MADQKDFFTLDDFNAALPPDATQPAPAQPSATAPAPAIPAAPPAPDTNKYISVDELSPQADKPVVGTAEDVGRGVLAGTGTAAFSDVPGLLVGAPMYYTSGNLTDAQLEQLYKEASPDELLDIQEGNLTPVPIAPEDYAYTMMPMGPMPLYPSQSSGKQFTLVPTMQGGQKILEEKMPVFAYEPQTKVGDIAKSASRAGTGALLMGGGPEAVLPATVAGGAGRLVGQTAEAFSENPVVVGGSEIATNIITDALTRRFGKVVSDLAMPNQEAIDRISQSISLSLSSDPEKRRVVLQAIQEGKPININDLVDPKTRTWMEKNLPGDYYHSILDFEADLAPRKIAADQATDEAFKNIFGEDLSDNGWQVALEKAQAAETNLLYKAVRANPAADNLFTPDLQSLIGQDKLIQTAAIDVAELARSGSLGPDISPLAIRRGAKGKPVIQGNTTPNFDYWDQVKQNLDSKANEFERAGNNFQAGIYRKAAEKVRNAVSDVIGEYPAARASAQKGFQTPTSLEEGYNFTRTISGEKPNLERVDDFLSAFDKADPEQKLRIQQGVGRGLLQIGQRGNFKEISRLMTSKQTRQALEKILGPDKFQQVYGSIAQNALLKTTTGLSAAAQNRVLQAQAGKNPALRDLFVSLTSGGGAAGLAAYGQSSTAMMVGAVGAGLVSVGMLGKMGMNAREQRVAARIFDLMTSNDPKNVQKVGEILASDVSAVTALRKYNEYVNNTVRTGFLAAAREEDRKRKVTEKMESEGNFVTPDIIPGFNDGQARGGRIERKAGGRVANSISAEVVRTRALLGNKTASILSIPDDAIISALNLARKK